MRLFHQTLDQHATYRDFPRVKTTRKVLVTDQIRIKINLGVIREIMI